MNARARSRAFSSSTAPAPPPDEAAAVVEEVDLVATPAAFSQLDNVAS